MDRRAALGLLSSGLAVFWVLCVARCLVSDASKGHESLSGGAWSSYECRRLIVFLGGWVGGHLVQGPGHGVGGGRVGGPEGGELNRGGWRQPAGYSKSDE